MQATAPKPFNAARYGARAFGLGGPAQLVSKKKVRRDRKRAPASYCWHWVNEEATSRVKKILGNDRLGLTQEETPPKPGFDPYDKG